MQRLLLIGIFGSVSAYPNKKGSSGDSLENITQVSITPQKTVENENSVPENIPHFKVPIQNEVQRVETIFQEKI